MTVSLDNNQTLPPTKNKSIILCVLCLWSLWVFFPGSYSIDSWNMYGQAASGTYSDWHTPVFSFTWRVLLLITKKYYSIYLLQLLLYWVFVWLLLVRVNKGNFLFLAGTIFSVLLLFIPQYVMKDTHMAICWGIAALLLLIVSEKYTPKKNRLLLSGVVLLSYGALIRINALPAALPLCYLFATLFRPQASRIVKMAIAVAACIALFFLNDLITYKLLHANRDHAAYKLELLDIIGISKSTGENYMPENIRSFAGYDEAKIATQYTPATIDDLYWPADQKYVFPNPDEALSDSVHSRWKQAVTQHPLAYLGNRTEGFLYYLKIKKRFAPGDYWNAAIWIDPNNPLQAKRTGNYFTDRFQHTYSRLGNSWFFTPWVWLLLNVLLFFYFSKKHRRNNYLPYKVIALIQLSAIVYTLSQLPVYQHDRDFRYHYWNVLSVFIGFIYYFKPLPGAPPGGCSPIRFNIRVMNNRNN